MHIIIPSLKLQELQGGIIVNDEARKHIEHALNSLNEAKDCLIKASSNSENGTMRERIESEVTHIDNCVTHCEGIASGLSQQ